MEVAAMKKRTAFLLILLLLTLSGCRVQPGGADNTAVPSVSSLPTPVSIGPTAAQTASPGPVETNSAVSPSPTGTAGGEAPPAEPSPTPSPSDAGSDTERYEAALAWCEANRGGFSNYDLYALDRSYWFADYAPGVTAVAYEGGNAWFYEDPSGAVTPAEAADILFQYAGACFPSQEPEDWAAQKERIARRAAAQTEGGGEAAERYLAEELSADPGYFVGLGEDMWLCGVAPQDDLSVGWYVLMKQGNVYRLQHDRAFTAYAQSPEARIRIQLDRALEAWNWFAGMTLPSVFEDEIHPEDSQWAYYRVDYPGISTMLELRTYLKTLFSDEIVDNLLAEDSLYREFDGVLYVTPLDAGYPAFYGTEQVQRLSDTKLNYHMEGSLVYGDPSTAPVPVVLDFPYELVGDKWVFTEFSWPG